MAVSPYFFPVSSNVMKYFCKVFFFENMCLILTLYRIKYPSVDKKRLLYPSSRTPPNPPVLTEITQQYVSLQSTPTL